MTRKTYILADNQDITREGLISILHKLNAENEIVTVSSCNELAEKLKVFPESVIILDYALFDFVSVQQFVSMKAEASQTSWLFFLDELSDVFLRQILLSDSTISVVMKYETTAEIIEAIQTVSTGEVYLCEVASSILESNAHNPDAIGSLTATEKMILREIAFGKMTKEIAMEKSLSFHTVNTHRKNIFRKLNVNNAHEATKRAIRAGLIDLLEYWI